MSDPNLSTMFDTVATPVPDQVLLTWRGQHHTYAEVNDRAQGLAHYLVDAQRSCRGVHAL
jgi:non-ribosomal peptide synthetase component F